LALALALVAIGCLAFTLHAARPPPTFARAGPPLRCDVPVERTGAGVVCLAQEEARARGLAAGDALDGRRMLPERLAAWSAAVDVNRASAEELASLDGVGEKLAARIVAARPFVTIDDVGLVKGIGMRRLARLRSRLVLDE
jgi:competence ComEA-like helix-hairpin-helix protein